MTRDRHAFSELDKIIKKSPQKQFIIKFYAIKNRILKKNRIKNAFYLEKLALEKGVQRTRIFH